MMPFQAMRLRSASGGIPPFWAVETYSVLDGTTLAAAERIGWSFTVGGSDLSCNSLRVITASAATGMSTIIHRNSDDAVIASANIPVSGLLNIWYVGSTSPFTLQAGVSYTISSRNTGGNVTRRRNNTVTIMTGITKNGDVFGTGDTRPTSATANTYQYCDFGWV